MIEITSSQQLKELISVNKLVIVDFWAKWCMPCKFMLPILEEISKEKNITIIKVNIDDYISIANEYNVNSLPTLLFYKNNELKHQLIGSKRKDQIIDVIEQYQ